MQEGTYWGASFSFLTIDISNDDTKNVTSNGARGAKMIFLSGPGAKIIFPSGRDALQNELRITTLNRDSQQGMTK